VTSGLRIGTPAVTTRGFREDEIVTVAGLINKALENINMTGYFQISGLL
jgi:glycine hydroxymethyltransferase